MAELLSLSSLCPLYKKAADNDEPGFMYYFMSVISDVAANRFINSSAIYYAPNMSFTPSYKGFFNKTMPLFAPRAYRADDFNDPYHLEGTSTLNTIDAVDLGAIPADTPSRNYSSDQYRINEWYHHWLPDPTKRQDSKTTYTIQITHFNGTNETFVWHGPPGKRLRQVVRVVQANLTNAVLQLQENGWLLRRRGECMDERWDGRTDGHHSGEEQPPPIFRAAAVLLSLWNLRRSVVCYLCMGNSGKSVSKYTDIS
ncbi:hypothetical protein HPB51_023391 [Rhipicephalus microplus]|uniref:Uncharacterized protein n=1 Tax=Rhipicephalus microplus TaxID=6941 RepID=A0A9J6DJR3_RHIMP|nr:hypothetical protein HPB51_023391 [Rhipicephalus microplus]